MDDGAFLAAFFVFPGILVVIALALGVVAVSAFTLNHITGQLFLALLALLRGRRDRTRQEPASADAETGSL